MRADHDSEADALYVRPIDGPAARCVEFGLHLVVDLDAEGRPLGVELISPGVPFAPELARAASRYRLDAEAITRDLLVVLDSVEPGAARRRLMGAIRGAIAVRAPIGVPVTDSRECERRRDVVGSLHHWPLREGEVVYERAA